MSSDSPDLYDPETLKGHRPWVLRMARALVGDSAAAEELAQETWVLAYEAEARGRGPRTNLRAWLRSTMRNAWLRARRSEGRRQEYERAAARPDTQAPESDVAERASMHRLLVEIVTELPEPLRTTLLLRYFDDLSPTEIASTLGIPRNTVRDRLRRGLETLRRRLDERHGGDRSLWAPALLPLLLPPRVAPSAAAGAVLSLPLIVMSTKTLALVGALLLIGALCLAPFLLENAPDETVAVEAPARDDSRVGPAELVVAEREAPAFERSRERLELAASESVDVSASVPRIPRGSIRGTVVGVRAEVLAGAVLEWVPESTPEAGSSPAAVRTSSGIDGRFELAVPGSGGRIRGADERYATVFSGRPRAGAPDPVVVLGPRIEAAGSVVDEFGVGLADAGVEYRLPKGFDTGFPHVLDAAYAVTFRARTDASGRFVFPALPGVPGAEFAATRPGYEDTRVESDGRADRDLLLVMRPRNVSRGALRGIVLSTEGDPVPDAWVSADEWVERTDERGEFVFSPGFAQQAEELVATAAGRLPGRVRTSGSGAHGGWPEYVTIRLGGAPLRIEGVVVDESGRPCPGVRVWVDDTTPFGGLDRGGPIPLESLIVAAPSRDELLAAGLDVAESPNEFYYWTKADEAGRFVLEGLTERSYRLGAMDRESMVLTRLADVPAGARDVRVVLPAESGTRPVAGRVLDEAGLPIEGAEVAVRRIPYRVGGVTWTLSGLSVATDDEGSFLVPRAPLEGTLRIQASGMQSRALSLAEFDDPEDLRVTLAPALARVHVQIVLDDPEFADAVRFLRDDGGPAQLQLVRGTSIHGMLRVRLVDGRSSVLQIDEGSYTVQFLRGESEVGRRRELVRGVDVMTIGR